MYVLVSNGFISSALSIIFTGLNLLVVLRQDRLPPFSTLKGNPIVSFATELHADLMKHS